MPVFDSPHSWRSRCRPVEGWCSSTPRCYPCGSAVPRRAPGRTVGCRSIPAGWCRVSGMLLPIEQKEVKHWGQLNDVQLRVSSDLSDEVALFTSGMQPTGTRSFFKHTKKSSLLSQCLSLYLHNIHLLSCGCLQPNPPPKKNVNCNQTILKTRTDSKV